HRIRKISPNGDVTTFAGSGVAGLIDGYGTAAQFNNPTSITIDTTGNLYITDLGTNSIRKIDPNANVTTLNGLVDIYGTAIQFNGLAGIALDVLGNIYVTEFGNNAIHKINPDGLVITLIDKYAAIALNNPWGIDLDEYGNIYVSDSGNNRIVKIVGQDILPPTFNFQSSNSLTVLSPAFGSAIASSDPTIQAFLNSVTASDMIDGTITSVTNDAPFSFPFGTTTVTFTATDAAGNIGTRTAIVTVSDQATLLGATPLTSNSSITVPAMDIYGVPDTQVTISNFLQSGLWAVEVDLMVQYSAYYPFSYTDHYGIFPIGTTVVNFEAFDVNSFYMSTMTGLVTVVPPSWADINSTTTLAGTGVAGFADGYTTAQLFLPRGIAIDVDGYSYVADTNNNRIRKIDIAGNVTTLAGSGTAGFVDGTGGAAQFYHPHSVTLDSYGNVYVADTYNHRIRKIDATTNVVTTLAGSVDIYGRGGSLDGATSIAQFNAPQDLAVDAAGNVYIADTNNNSIRKIDIATGIISTLTNTLNRPQGIAISNDGIIYVADTGNNRIIQINDAGNVIAVAGSGVAGFADVATNWLSALSSAQFNAPQDVAVDSGGNIYVADTGNGVVRRIGLNQYKRGLGSNGIDVSTLPNSNSYVPAGLATDVIGNVYVADSTKIHKIVVADAIAPVLTLLPSS
ncbi:MAG: HYR domain-containing protein, partial [Mariprofundales bacterium]